MKSINLLFKIALGLLITTLSTSTVVGMKKGHVTFPEANPHYTVLEAIRNPTSTVKDLEKIIQQQIADTRQSSAIFLNTKIKLARQNPRNPTEFQDYHSCLLHEAIADGSLEKVNALFQLGASLEALDSDQNTALLKATCYNQLAIVCYLLDHGSNIYAVNKTQMSALGIALCSGDMPTIKEIIGYDYQNVMQHRRPDEKAPGTPEDIQNVIIITDQWLEDMLDCADLLGYSLNDPNFPSNPRALNRPYHQTPLHNMVMIGALELIKHCDRSNYHQSGIQNDKGNMPVHIAINEALENVHLLGFIRPRRLAVIKTLLESNPDSVHYRTKCGRTPLHLACQGKNIELIALLLSYGAKPDDTIQPLQGGEIAITPRMLAKKAGLENEFNFAAQQAAEIIAVVKDEAAQRKIKEELITKARTEEIIAQIQNLSLETKQKIITRDQTVFINHEASCRTKLAETEQIDRYRIVTDMADNHARIQRQIIFPRVVQTAANDAETSATQLLAEMDEKHNAIMALYQAGKRHIERDMLERKALSAKLLAQREALEIQRLRDHRLEIYDLERALKQEQKSLKAFQSNEAELTILALTKKLFESTSEYCSQSGIATYHPLYAAVLFDTPVVIDYLLKEGKPPTHDIYKNLNPLKLAISNYNEKALKALLVDPKTYRPRGYAQELVNQQLDFDNDAVSPLHYAISIANGYAVNLLLECGAKTDDHDLCFETNPKEAAQLYLEETNPDDPTYSARWAIVRLLNTVRK